MLTRTKALIQEEQMSELLSRKRHKTFTFFIQTTVYNLQFIHFIVMIVFQINCTFFSFNFIASDSILLFFLKTILYKALK